MKIQIRVKSLNNEKSVLLNEGVIEYFDGSEKKVFEDEEVVSSVLAIYNNNKEYLVDTFQNVKALGNTLTRPKNTARKDLVIVDDNLEMIFDCYVQEYAPVVNEFVGEVLNYLESL